jgi:hypothetical protein
MIFRIFRGFFGFFGIFRIFLGFLGFFRIFGIFSDFWDFFGIFGIFSDFWDFFGGCTRIFGSEQPLALYLTLEKATTSKRPLEFFEVTFHLGVKKLGHSAILVVISQWLNEDLFKYYEALASGHSRSS